MRFGIFDFSGFFFKFVEFSFFFLFRILKNQRIKNVNHFVRFFLFYV